MNRDRIRLITAVVAAAGISVVAVKAAKPARKYLRHYKQRKGRTYSQDFAGPPASNNGLKILVRGNADDGFWLDGEGFCPRGRYVTEVWYPEDSPQKGAKYTYIENGRADRKGKTPRWFWDCSLTEDGQRDPEGVYKLTMTDCGSQTSVTTTFILKYQYK